MLVVAQKKKYLNKSGIRWLHYFLALYTLFRADFHPSHMLLGKTKCNLFDFLILHT